MVLTWQPSPDPQVAHAIWYFVHPPGGFVAPVFPQAVAAPTGTVSISQLAIEVSAWDARRLRRDYPAVSNWRQFYEINGSVGPEPYLGRGVSTRVPHTVTSATAQ